MDVTGARHCQIIPPYLLQHIATAHPDQAVVDCSMRTLRVDTGLREARSGRRPVSPAPSSGGPQSVHTARNGTELPGDRVRAGGDPASGDKAVDEAYDGVAACLALFSEVYGRASFDGHGAPVVSTVHFDRDYDNAFWNGEQLVFGDGDGKVFDRFTKPVDVLGHELTHAVTQHTADLAYQGQSGALNESVSDVFGSCLKQRLLGQQAADADWLIGEGLFVPGIRGVALRSMKDPGTAYDDPALGRDPQVGSMADYVHTNDDNGGVHINSGIPNRAFQLAAVAVGGNAWEGAGRIWYAALTSGLSADTDFAGFARATVEAAAAVSTAARDAVAQAWDQVGVGTTAPTPSSPAPGPGDQGPRVVAVTRTGGFAGVRQRGEVALGEDPRSPEVESLLGRIDFRGVTAGRPQPDRFVYTFHVQGEETTLGEQDLTPDLERLVTIVLS